MRVDSKKDKEGCYTLIPHGSIDTDSHDVLRKSVEPYLVESTRVIRLDLADVDYISSAGLGVIFAIKKFLDKHDAKLVLFHPKPQIRKLFDTVKFLTRDLIFHSIEEADAYLHRFVDKEIFKQNKGRIA